MQIYNSILENFIKVELYNLTLQDVDEMIEIQKQTDIKSYVNKYKLTIDNILQYDWESRKQDRKDQLQNKNYIWVALKKDNEIIAYGCLGNLNNKTINLYNIMVRPDYQNQKLGSFIVNYLLQKAPLKKIELETTIAKDFYKKFGFKSYKDNTFKMYLNNQLKQTKLKKKMPEGIEINSTNEQINEIVINTHLPKYDPKK